MSLGFVPRLGSDLSVEHWERELPLYAEVTRIVDTGRLCVIVLGQYHHHAVNYKNMSEAEIYRALCRAIELAEKDFYAWNKKRKGLKQIYG